MSKELTLGKLYEQIGEQLRICPDKADDVVCIALPPGGFGGRRTVGVNHAHCGFDWDNGKFIIYPSEILIKDEK